MIDIDICEKDKDERLRRGEIGGEAYNSTRYESS